MVVKALETLRNAYDQVLFLDGHEYHAKMSPTKVYVFNELHTESPFTVKNFREKFEMVDLYA